MKNPRKALASCGTMEEKLALILIFGTTQTATLLLDPGMSVYSRAASVQGSGLLQGRTAPEKECNYERQDLVILQTEFVRQD